MSNENSTTMLERVAQWFVSSGASGTSIAAVSTGPERLPETRVAQPASPMVAVLPDLREISISAVQQLAKDDSRLATSEQQSQAALVYEQVILAL